MKAFRPLGALLGAKMLNSATLRLASLLKNEHFYSFPNPRSSFSLAGPWKRAGMDGEGIFSRGGAGGGGERQGKKSTGRGGAGNPPSPRGGASIPDPYVPQIELSKHVTL